MVRKLDMENKRYLGLDIGKKRIGVALSDPLYIIASPLKTIERQPESRSVAEIKQLCDEFNVSVIIVWLPLNMNGSLCHQAQDAKYYASLIKENTDFEIIFEDERLSSFEAERILIEQNKKPSKNKGLIDMTAAAIVLQEFLNKRR